MSTQEIIFLTILLILVLIGFIGWLGIKLKMPSQKEPEIIMNYNSSIDVKLEYYLNTYDDNLVHKNNSEIQIIDMIGTSIPF